MAQSAYYTATWGRIRLWLGTTNVDNSTDIVVHNLSSGNSHPTRNSGLAVRRTRAILLFDEFDGESDTPSNRFRAFKALVDSGAEAIFVHPIDGAFLASVGPFTYDLEPGYDYPTNVAVEFIAAEEIEAVSPAGAGTSGIAGEGAVTQAADDLDLALEVLAFEALPDSVTTKARAATESWNEGETVPTRQILTDTADLSDQLSTMIDSLGLEDDLALFGAYRASIMFGESIRAAAIAATSEVPAVFVLRVMLPCALLPLMAKIYGGAEAEERLRQVAELNDIRTVGWFGPGELLCPVKSKSQRVI